MTTTPARVRFAPSPTGYLHAGVARTALFNWLYARHTGGQFIFRLEDTDQTRSVPDALDNLTRHLRWLGLDWDEGLEVGGPHAPYIQSQRLDIYQKHTQRLLDTGHAYRCYCTPERLEALREEQRRRKETPGYDRRCRYLTAAERAQKEAEGAPSVVRLAVPLDGETTFRDIIRGDITVANDTLDDLVLLKSDGFPTYHLANVVDDHLMEITHILRGDEWLSSVPKHILLYRAFGWQPPVMAHLPLILDPSGHGKMSKRKKREDGGQPVFIHEFRQAGYLPEALFNYLSLLGWSYDGHTEIFSRDDAARLFDVKDVLPKPAAFNYEKLEWMNGVYIRNLPVAELKERLAPFVAQGVGLAETEVRQRPEMDVLVPHLQERLKALTDVTAWVDFAFTDTLHYDIGLLPGKKMTWAETAAALEQAIATLAALPAWEEAPMDAQLRALAERLRLKVGQLFGILRVATTGKDVALPLFVNLLALGRERTLRRLHDALAQAQQQAVAPDPPPGV